MQAMINDLRGKANVIVLTDATTGKSMASRRGLGKVRHIEVAELWIQPAVRDERVQIRKIKGTVNPADLFTKHLDRQKLDLCVEPLDGKYTHGRHEAAPALDFVTDINLQNNILDYYSLKNYDINAIVETHRKN